VSARRGCAAYRVSARFSPRWHSIPISASSACASLPLVYACGKIINPLLAKSQLIGGITWGMSQALFEATHMDGRFGRFTNTNMAEYMIPVNLDVPVIEVAFLDDPDPFINPIGVKAVGEIGITSVAAAILDAVWDATGKRLRSTPILAEALLGD
jgi:xanthine dehydrogenase YagR molybdenum-binding subunit